MKHLLIATALIIFIGISAFAASGAEELYKSKCMSCHGADGTKEALGTSAPLKGQSASDILSKLKGYADGSYGGSKKVIMKGQVGRLSEEELKSLADYIATF
ncbi:c-type cytochrome [Limisalsivibrio acetivorans]|uniref:c-type cytochrome n=1 Tax=Limisalsivibrio acetivorans TaxID=1304888 RepID=UPI0003B50E25|nr:c-type cytochrome [Limisalsivibrio acetivorans]